MLPSKYVKKTIFLVSALLILEIIVVWYIKDIPLWTALQSGQLGLQDGGKCLGQRCCAWARAPYCVQMCLFVVVSFSLWSGCVFVLFSVSPIALNLALNSVGSCLVISDGAAGAWPTWDRMSDSSSGGWAARLRYQKNNWFEWSAWLWLVATVHLCTVTAKNDQFGI